MHMRFNCVYFVLDTLYTNRGSVLKSRNFLKSYAVSIQFGLEFKMPIFLPFLILQLLNAELVSANSA